MSKHSNNKPNKKFVLTQELRDRGFTKIDFVYDNQNMKWLLEITFSNIDTSNEFEDQKDILITLDYDDNFESMAKRLNLTLQQYDSDIISKESRDFFRLKFFEIWKNAEREVQTNTIQQDQRQDQEKGQEQVAFTLSENTKNAGVTRMYRKMNTIFADININTNTGSVSCKVFSEIIPNKLDDAPENIRKQSKQTLKSYNIPEEVIANLINCISMELIENYHLLADLSAAGVQERERQESFDEDDDEDDNTNNKIDYVQAIKENIYELFLDNVKTPYAAIKQNYTAEDGTEKSYCDTIPIESDEFLEFAGYTYYNVTRNAKIQKALQKAQDTDEEIDLSKIRGSVLTAEQKVNVKSILKFELHKSENIKKLHLRVNSVINDENSDTPDEPSVVYYDLCNKYGEIVKITAQGWQIIPHDKSNIMFKRYNKNLPQVYPKRNYSADIMDQFLTLINVSNKYEYSQDDKLLTKVYIISLLLLSELPKPIMNIHAIHGTGKTVSQGLINKTIDPSTSNSPSMPSNIIELPQILNHTYITYFDNVTRIKDDVSDWFCRAVTGTSSSKRGLYTDDKDVIFSMMRAVGYNGINIGASKPDLLDRMLSLEFGGIDKKQRWKLQKINKEFNRMLPELLGFIFDVVVKVLSRIGTVHLEELTRMADFHEMGELISRCLGYEDFRFDKAYQNNINTINKEAIDSNPVAIAINFFMETQPKWEGKINSLRIELNNLISNSGYHDMMRGKDWPKTYQALVEEINKVVPNLKELGIIISKKEDRHTKSSTYKIENNNYSRNNNNSNSKSDDEPADSDLNSKEAV